MKDQEFYKIIGLVNRALKAAFFVIFLIFSVVVYLALDAYLPSTSTIATNESVQTGISEIVDGVHVETGLKEGAGLDVVIQNCTPCHSAKLITQNRMTFEGWKSTIKWMQETQNLWGLGDNEQIILEYLSNYYAPQKKGRRSNLANIEWYELD